MSEKSAQSNKVLGDLGDVLARKAAEQAARQKIRASLPSAAAFLLQTPLYKGVKLEADIHGDLVYQLKIGELNVDCHCIWCDRSSPFKREKPQSINYDWAKSIADTSLAPTMQCQRDQAHKYQFWIEIRDGVLRKIGQTPSLEDIAYSDVTRYRKVLGEKSFRELHRAGGLATAGIGIGAFVYLRRIFERMIAEHHQQLSSGGKVDGFDAMRLEEQNSGASRGATSTARQEPKSI